MLLNRIFGGLIDIIYRHGGDIIKFAGDALLVAWRVEGLQDDRRRSSLGGGLGDGGRGGGGGEGGGVGGGAPSSVSSLSPQSDGRSLGEDAQVPERRHSERIRARSVGAVALSPSSTSRKHLLETPLPSSVNSTSSSLSTSTHYGAGEFKGGSRSSLSAEGVQNRPPRSERKRALAAAMGLQVRKAVCCALEALAWMAHRDADDQLGLHVAIGASSMCGLHVGGLLHRYEYFIVGDAILQMGRAERVAKDGDLVISPESFESLRAAMPEVGAMVEPAPAEVGAARMGENAGSGAAGVEGGGGGGVWVSVTSWRAATTTVCRSDKSTCLLPLWRPRLQQRRRRARRSGY